MSSFLLVETKFLQIIISVVDICDPNPCNGGKCVVGGPEGYKCEKCPTGMLGKHCDGNYIQERQTNSNKKKLSIHEYSVECTSWI